jgi:hypothetical protein
LRSFWELEIEVIGSIPFLATYSTNVDNQTDFWRSNLVLVSGPWLEASSEKELA